MRDAATSQTVLIASMQAETAATCYLQILFYSHATQLTGFQVVSRQYHSAANWLEKNSKKVHYFNISQASG
jgi:hypothetical protein